LDYIANRLNRTPRLKSREEAFEYAGFDMRQVGRQLKESSWKPQAAFLPTLEDFLISLVIAAYERQENLSLPIDAPSIADQDRGPNVTES
jgi:hypothetical protein